MTHDSKRKKTIRAYAEKHGLKYTEAARRLTVHTKTSSEDSLEALPLGEVKTHQMPQGTCTFNYQNYRYIDCEADVPVVVIPHSWRRAPKPPIEWPEDKELVAMQKLLDPSGIPDEAFFGQDFEWPEEWKAEAEPYSLSEPSFENDSVNEILKSVIKVFVEEERKFRSENPFFITEVGDLIWSQAHFGETSDGSPNAWWNFYQFIVRVIIRPQWCGDTDTYVPSWVLEASCRTPRQSLGTGFPSTRGRTSRRSIRTRSPQISLNPDPIIWAHQDVPPIERIHALVKSLQYQPWDDIQHPLRYPNHPQAIRRVVD